MNNSFKHKISAEGEEEMATITSLDGTNRDELNFGSIIIYLAHWMRLFKKECIQLSRWFLVHKMRVWQSFLLLTGLQKSKVALAIKKIE